MAFTLFGSRPGFLDFTASRRGLSLPERPSIDDLMDEEVYPEYPLPPELLTRGRQLDRPGKRQLTMAMLANVAQALSGAGGNLGGRLAGAAAANASTEQDAVGLANERQAAEYRRQVQGAEEAAGRKRDEQKRARDREQIESMLAVGDKAIELAGGADTDPKFATKVFSLMRERNASALNAALDEAVQRRTMREQYEIDPDDPMALEAFKEQRQREGKVEDERVIGKMQEERATRAHATNRLFDLAHPTPQEPRRDREQFDPTTGQIINIDRRTASEPLSGYTPRPRSGGLLDEVEQEAADTADRQQAAYEKDPARPFYQNEYPRLPGYKPDPKDAHLLGQPVPFDWYGAYQAAERTRRRIVTEREAAADPSTGGRGGPPVVEPQRRGVQSPEGAPVGMGGGKTTQPARGKLSETEKQALAAEAQKRWQKLTPQQRAQFGNSFSKFLDAAVKRAAAGKGQ